MGDGQSVEDLQRLEHIGLTRNNVTHAGNVREVCLAGVLNVKVHGYSEETNEVFEYLGCFGIGVYACPTDTNQLVRPRKLWRTGMRKQKQGCRKSETLVIRLLGFGGVSLEKS